MEETIYHKFTQHAALLKELLDTGNAELVEVRNRSCSFYESSANHVYPRIPTKMRSGVSALMAKEEMSSEKL